MNKSPKNDLPWELIAESLSGSLSVEAEDQLQQWISSASENREKYLQIKELWKNGIEDYKFYRLADEEKSWNALHAKMRTGNGGKTYAKVIRPRFNQGDKLIRNLITIAAAVIVVVSIGLWFIFPSDKPLIYQTAFNVQKKVKLMDGSVIILKPNTKIEIPSAYNKSRRTIIMNGGEAWFDVVHNSAKAFIVKLGSTQITDIGTSFSIRKKLNSIDVSVSTGKIAFVKLSTRETRELNAGSAITFDEKNESFGQMRSVDTMGIDEQLPDFKNTPLATVIASVQKVYGKKIMINDGIAGKTFTGQLNGMPYNTVIRVICESLGLEYSVKDSIYILKAKTFEQP
jgi:transmembrane sensor